MRLTPRCVTLSRTSFRPVDPPPILVEHRHVDGRRVGHLDLQQRGARLGPQDPREPVQSRVDQRRFLAVEESVGDAHIFANDDTGRHFGMGRKFKRATENPRASSRLPAART